MITQFSFADQNHQKSEETPSCHLVIIYEDLASGKRANHFCENLKLELGGSMIWTKELWSFKVLEFPHVRDAAVEEASMADVVILALDGGEGLPDGVQIWMKNWVDRVADRNPILLALFNTPDDGPGNVTALGSTAEKAGLTFLHTRGVARKAGSRPDSFSEMFL